MHTGLKNYEIENLNKVKTVTSLSPYLPLYLSSLPDVCPTHIYTSCSVSLRNLKNRPILGRMKKKQGRGVEGRLIYFKKLVHMILETWQVQNMQGRP